MATVKQIYDRLDHWAPFETQMGFDNAGHLIGRSSAEVTGVLVALDITLPVVEEARTLGCNLIVAHHPVIFEPVRTIVDSDSTGEVLLAMIERGISAICAHTNLDAAQGGVNDCLANKLGLKDTVFLEDSGVDRLGRSYGIGRVGTAEDRTMSASEYAAFVKLRLEAASVRYVDAGKPVSRVAVGGGSCGSMLLEAFKAGCDTFVTADVKHNVFLEAKALGLNLMDAGHYATENVVCPAIAEKLRASFPETRVVLSKVHKEAYQGV